MISSIFSRMKGTVGSSEYDAILKEETQRAFPDAPKPLFHVTHWLLRDNRALVYMTGGASNGKAAGEARVRKNYFCSQKEIESIAAIGVRKYLVAIVAKAEDPEKAMEYENCSTEPDSSK